MNTTVQKTSTKERIEALLQDNPYATNSMLMECTGLSESTVNTYAKPWREQRGVVSYQRRQIRIEALLTEDPARSNTDLQHITGYSLAACAKYADPWRTAYHIAPPVMLPARTEEKKVYRRSKPSKLKHPPQISEDQRRWHLAQFMKLPDLAQRCMLMWIDQAIVASEYLEERNAYALRRDFIDSAGFAVSEAAFCGAMLARGHDPRDGSAPHWQFYIQRKAENPQEPQSYIPPDRGVLFEAMCDQVDRLVDVHGLLYDATECGEGESDEGENAATPNDLEC